jgi:radical SAM protein with 4Fe4S-binding SPASM domain
MTTEVLATITIDNDLKNLYQQLVSVKRSEFKDNQCIVLEYNTDQFEYAGYPGTQLSKTIQYLNEIDIPLFFVQLNSGYEFIDTNLVQLGGSEVTVNKTQVEFNYQDQTTRDSFCILPWIHLYIGTDGNVLPCCMADQQLPLGNINNDGIEHIVNSARALDLRSNMLSNKKSKECSQCYVQEDVGSKSYRQSSNQRWQVPATDIKIDNFMPKYLDIRVSNLCNLKCRMCSDYFSSAIAQENKELYGIPNTIKIEKKDAIEKISKYLASVEKIYFAGGEPLLIQEHYDILDRLIAVGNTNVEITYNTNFTKLQFKHRHIFDLWKQFSNITIGASLDAMGPAAEYIRHGTVWDDIEKNLTQLQKECPHVKFTVTSTVHMLNIESLIQLQKHWHQIPFSFTKLAQPEHLTVQVLPLHHKQRLAKIINLHVNWLQDKEKYPLALAWQSIVKYMFADDCSYKLKEFKRLTLELDQYRKESFQSVFPQYKDLLDV